MPRLRYLPSLRLSCLWRVMVAVGTSAYFATSTSGAGLWLRRPPLISPSLPSCSGMAADVISAYLAMQLGRPPTSPMLPSCRAVPSAGFTIVPPICCGAGRFVARLPIRRYRLGAGWRLMCCRKRSRLARAGHGCDVCFRLLSSPTLQSVSGRWLPQLWREWSRVPRPFSPDAAVDA